MVKMSYYADYSNYTDWHGVDEELTIICKCGGDLNDGVYVGVAFRDLLDTPSSTGGHNTVASRLIYLS